MVAESSRKPTRTNKQELTSEELKSVLAWIRLLQQALTLEAENDFKNIQGRKDYFNSFLVQQLNNAPKEALLKERQQQLDLLIEGFLLYPSSANARRRRLVTSARQFLHGLGRHVEPSVPMAPPTLNHLKVEPNLKRTFRQDEKSLSLDSALTRVKGIGPKLAERFAGLGIFVIRDLLQYYPRDYVDYSSLRRIEALELGETATIVATVRRCNGFRSPKNPNLSILELYLQDPTGKIKVTRFFAGRRFSSAAFLKSQASLYPPGTTVAVSGLVKRGSFGISFQDPLIEVMDNPKSPIHSRRIGRLLPVYSLTEGLTADRFRDVVEKVLPLADKWPDPLDSLRAKELGMPTTCEAMVAIHRPESRESLRLARKRLVFDEFYVLQIGFLQRRKQFRERPAPPLNTAGTRDGLVGKFFDLLPFSLTAAQQRVLAEVEQDLSCSKPMARLVQGDVGSGKTVVAVAALLTAVQEGWQGAFMAPTEVLAGQHFQNLARWLPELHVSTDLLTGSTTRGRRKHILDDLANGTLNLLVGTHALLEDPVVFSRLGLVVVDEQHRFGVRQRNRLLSKGLQPHLLTMTATPIPRTMALSIHGDLDVSQIDELPPGRMPIQMRLVGSSGREDAYQLIREEASRGQQAYVILPLVEESEKLNLRSAVDVHSQLSEEVFPDFNVGLLHGRLNSEKKQKVINDFAKGECQILVSTTVVEVGVDVPQATVILIDHADRFGLAQLHQLRGRVGRGTVPSHCVLINESSNPLARQRLEVLMRSNDGFEIAEIDLRLRGPGQVLGTKQSGIPDLALASLAEDGEVLEQARAEAINVLDRDPELFENQILKQLVEVQTHLLSGIGQLN